MDDYAWCQCFAIWVPDSYRHHDAYDFYVRARDFFYAQAALHADRMTPVRDAREIDAVLAQGKVAALLTLENTTPINHSVRAIQDLAADGVKMVTLTWNDRNSIGSGNLTNDGLTTLGREAIRAFEDARIVVDVSHLNRAGFADLLDVVRRNSIGSGNLTNDGLTTLGREAIRAFEDARIVVDVSHLNRAGFADLLDVVRRPFVASHSNARAVCDHPRNLSDDQFRAIRDMGGLVGLNFYRSFITDRDTAATGEVTFDELAAHAEHFLDLGGEDTLALGSDWDGSDVPTWLATCDTAGELRRLMAQRFGAALTDKIFFTNARDFFVRNETE